MKIEINNLQQKHPVNLTKIETFSRWIMSRIQRQQADCGWKALSLVLADDPEMTVLNRKYFDKAQSTDVISFAYTPLPGEAPGSTGEVIVNVTCALREGPRHEGASHELAFYITHGCHHLAGATDDTPALRAAMHREEKGWLEEAVEAGLVSGLVAEPLGAGSP